MIISIFAIFSFLIFSTLVRAAEFTPAALPKVVIIGGGPAGLATASMLEARGWQDITVLEMRPKVTLEKQRSYLYQIDGRGLRILDRLNLVETLREEAINAQAVSSLATFFPNGRVKRMVSPVASEGRIEKHLIPRQSFLNVLQKRVDSTSAVQVFYGTSCSGVRIENGKFILSTTCKENQQVGEIEAEFVLGCEGINSLARNFLQSHYGGSFSVTKLPSPSAGLFYRIITLPLSLTLPSNDPVAHPYKSTSAYVIRFDSIRQSNKLISIF